MEINKRQKSLSDESFSEDEKEIDSCNLDKADSTIMRTEEVRGKMNTGLLYESGIVEWLKLFLKGTANLKLSKSDFKMEAFPFNEFCKYYNHFLHSDDANQTYNENFINQYYFPGPLTLINPVSCSQSEGTKISCSDLFKEIDFHCTSSDRTIDKFLKKLKNKMKYGYTLDLTFDQEHSKKANRVYELFVEVKKSLSLENWSTIISKHIPMLIRYYKLRQSGHVQNYKIGFMLIYNSKHYQNRDFLEGRFLKQKENTQTFLKKYSNLLKVLKFYSIDLKILFYSDMFLSHSAYSIYEEIKIDRAKDLENQKIEFEKQIENLKVERKRDKEDFDKQKLDFNKLIEDFEVKRQSDKEYFENIINQKELKK